MAHEGMKDEFTVAEVQVVSFLRKVMAPDGTEIRLSMAGRSEDDPKLMIKLDDDNKLEIPVHAISPLGESLRSLHGELVRKASKLFKPLQTQDAEKA